MINLIKSLFSKQTPASMEMLAVDMHSHLLPGIDDGAQTLEESLNLIRELVQIGYKHLITTPHTQTEQYKNTPEIIREKLGIVKQAIQEENIPVTIEAASEYLLDDGFMDKLHSDFEFLTFDKKKYILVETSFYNKPLFFEEAIKELRNRKFSPILAHPERYQYYWGKKEQLHKLKDLGLYLQVNLNSLTGFYTEHAQKNAEYMIKENLVDFVGTDTHHERHIQLLKQAICSKWIHQLIEDNRLFNSTLIP